MSDETPAPPDDWPHRHPHLATLVVAVAAGAFLGGALELGGSSTGTAVLGGVAIAAVVLIAAEVMSLLLRIPLIPAVLTGHPVAEYRYLGDHVGAHHAGMGDWGGGDGGGGG